jgi:3',5'-cyclic AMP phosphodiesterase CpdA
MPFYLMPGNHDSRANLRAAFPSHGYLGDRGFMQYEVEAGPLRLLCLDTLDEGHAGGRLCPERLAWLAARLAAWPERPVAIFMHHPPFPVGIPFMDRIALDETDALALAALIRDHGRIAGIYCGHLHRTVTLHWQGVTAMVAPGVAHQIYPDPRSGGHEAFIMEPPGMLLHRWVEGAGLVTQAQALGDYGPVHLYSN